jgi:hypothetical protein
MIGLLCFVLAALASPFKSKMRLEAENAVLRHQLIVLRRRLRGRVQLTNNDRWFFIQLNPAGSHNHPVFGTQVGIVALILNAFIGAVVLLLILRLVGGGWGYRRRWGGRL